MDPLVGTNRLHVTRREFFGRSACGIGTAALAWLLAATAWPRADATPSRRRVGGLPGLPHFAPKAKHVIYLFQNGAPDARRPVRLQAEARRRCTASRCPSRTSPASGSAP